MPLTLFSPISTSSNASSNRRSKAENDFTLISKRILENGYIINSDMRELSTITSLLSDIHETLYGLNLESSGFMDDSTHHSFSQFLTSGEILEYIREYISANDKKITLINDITESLSTFTKDLRNFFLPSRHSDEGCDSKSPRSVSDSTPSLISLLHTLNIPSSLQQSLQKNIVQSIPSTLLDIESLSQIILRELGHTFEESMEAYVREHCCNTTVSNQSLNLRDNSTGNQKGKSKEASLCPAKSLFNMPEKERLRRLEQVADNFSCFLLRFEFVDSLLHNLIMKFSNLMRSYTNIITQCADLYCQESGKDKKSTFSLLGEKLSNPCSPITWRSFYDFVKCEPSKPTHSILDKKLRTHTPSPSSEWLKSECTPSSPLYASSIVSISSTSSIHTKSLMREGAKSISSKTFREGIKRLKREEKKRKKREAFMKRQRGEQENTLISSYITDTGRDSWKDILREMDDSAFENRPIDEDLQAASLNTYQNKMQNANDMVLFLSKRSLQTESTCGSLSTRPASHNPSNIEEQPLYNPESKGLGKDFIWRCNTSVSDTEVVPLTPPLSKGKKGRPQLVLSKLERKKKHEKKQKLMELKSRKSLPTQVPSTSSLPYPTTSSTHSHKSHRPHHRSSTSQSVAKAITIGDQLLPRHICEKSRLVLSFALDTPKERMEFSLSQTPTVHQQSDIFALAELHSQQFTGKRINYSEKLQVSPALSDVATEVRAPAPEVASVLPEPTPPVTLSPPKASPKAVKNFSEEGSIKRVEREAPESYPPQKLLKVENPKSFVEERKWIRCPPLTIDSDLQKKNYVLPSPDEIMSSQGIRNASPFHVPKIQTKALIPFSQSNNNTPMETVNPHKAVSPFAINGGGRGGFGTSEGGLNRGGGEEERGRSSVHSTNPMLGRSVTEGRERVLHRSVTDVRPMESHHVVRRDPMNPGFQISRSQSLQMGMGPRQNAAVPPIHYGQGQGNGYGQQRSFGSLQSQGGVYGGQGDGQSYYGPGQGQQRPRMDNQSHGQGLSRSQSQGQGWGGAQSQGQGLGYHSGLGQSNSQGGVMRGVSGGGFNARADGFVREVSSATMRPMGAGFYPGMRETTPTTPADMSSQRMGGRNGGFEESIWLPPIQLTKK